ncbi:hypothetical protein KAU08_02360, partial [bacterium]|nr:hypothetical protein [bacterium]
VILKKIEIATLTSTIDDVKDEITGIENKVKKAINRDHEIISDLLIIAAIYGSDHDHSMDVTEKLNELVKNNEINVKATNILFGDDPHKLVKKKVFITYRYGGQNQFKVFDENEMIILP